MGYSECLPTRLNPPAERACFSQVIILIDASGSMRAEEVRKTPSWPRSWANFSLLSLYSRRNAWVNLHLLGQPNTFLA